MSASHAGAAEHRDEQETGASAQPRPSGTVVVGVDASDPSWSALRWAARHVMRLGGRLVVVHVWDVPRGWGMGLVSAPAEVLRPPEDAAARGRALVERAMAAAGLDVPFEVEVLQGYTAQTLMDASVGADLLVVGRHGAGGAARAVLGSVSRYVGAHASVPVVLVPDEVSP